MKRRKNVKNDESTANVEVQTGKEKLDMNDAATLSRKTFAFVEKKTFTVLDRHKLAVISNRAQLAVKLQSNCLSAWKDQPEESGLL